MNPWFNYGSYLSACFMHLEGVSVLFNKFIVTYQKKKIMGIIHLDTVIYQSLV